MKILPMINYDYNNRMGFNGRIHVTQGKDTLTLLTDGLIFHSIDSNRVSVYSPYGFYGVLNFSWDKFCSAYYRAFGDKDSYLTEEKDVPIRNKYLDKIKK